MHGPTKLGESRKAVGPGVSVQCWPSVQQRPVIIMLASVSAQQFTGVCPHKRFERGVCTATCVCACVVHEDNNSKNNSTDHCSAWPLSLEHNSAIVRSLLAVNAIGPTQLGAPPMLQLCPTSAQPASVNFRVECSVVYVVD
jgi:hypothetical protein